MPKAKKKPSRKLRGIGDVVAAVTHAVGIEPCEACEDRRERWNKKFPFSFGRKGHRT